MESFRLITPLERLPLSSNCYIQLSVRVDEERIGDFISIISTYMSGCRTLIKDQSIYLTSKPCEVFKLPDNIDNLIDAANYTLENFTVPLNVRLASIAHNNSILVFHSNHVVCDGRSAFNLLRLLTGEKMPKPQNILPEPMEVTFAEDLKNDYPIIPSDVTRFEAKMIDENETKLNFVHGCIPFNELKCFINGRLTGFNNYLWSAMSLIAAAHNNDFNIAAISTAVSLRQFLPDGDDWKYGNTFRKIIFEGSTKSKTVGELNKSFRVDFEEKIKEKLYIPIIKNIVNGVVPPRNYLSLELSNIGELHTGNGVNDAYISVSLKSPKNTYGELQITVFTINQNLKYIVRCPAKWVNYEDLEKIARSFEFFMTNVSENDLVDDVIENLKKI